MLPLREIVERGSRAAIVHGNELHAGHVLEQLDIHMRRGADARSAVGELARLLLRQRDEFGRIVGRQRLVGDEGLVDAHQSADRNEVLVGVVGQLAGWIEGRIDDECAGLADHQRVAVGVGLGDGLRAEDVGGAAAILDDDRLAPGLGKLLAERPRHHVGHAARGGGHDDGDRPVRIGCGLRGARAGRHCSRISAPSHCLIA